MAVNMNEKRLQVSLDADLHKAVFIKARQEDIAVSELVREWLEAWLNGDPAFAPKASNVTAKR